jgi:hypothetical protein
MTEQHRLEEAAGTYESAVEGLEQAAAHCRTAAGHARDREVPRRTAHAWAARDHLLAVRAFLDEQARVHATKSVP